jgi:hypothetical protein
MGGQLLSVFLLGQHGVKAGLHTVTRWRDGDLLIKERNSALKLAPVVAKLERRQGVHRVLGWFYGCGVGGHRWRS